jgi:hypothetical protein
MFIGSADNLFFVHWPATPRIRCQEVAGGLGMPFRGGEMQAATQVLQSCFNRRHGLPKRIVGSLGTRRNKADLRAKLPRGSAMDDSD